MIQSSTTSYGAVCNAYKASRQPFPPFVFDIIEDHLPQKVGTILDVGCGTGIATRQLYERFKNFRIIGTDPDIIMLQEAVESSNPRIKFDQASTADLRYATNTIDIITAFSAFHWFCDEASIEKIREVLKHDGLFFVVNKNDIAGFRKGFREKLRTIKGVSIPPSPKNAYFPTSILAAHGFRCVETITQPIKETMPLHKAMQHIESAGFWANIPKDKLPYAKNLMEDYIQNNKVDGQIGRLIEVEVVFGRK